MTHRTLLVRLGAVLAALMLILATPGSANAATVVKLRVGSSTEVAGSAVYVNPITDARQALRIIARFSNHKTESVKLTKFRLCWSQTGGGSEVLTSRIAVFGTTKWEGITKWDVASGSCTKWASVNKTFKGKPGKEMFTVRTDLGWSNYTDVHGFHR